jgi:flagellar biosynthesis protein FlhB
MCKRVFVAEILFSTIMLLFPIGVMLLVLHARSERQQLREFAEVDTANLRETMHSLVSLTLLLLTAVGCIFCAVRLAFVLMTAYHYTYCIRAARRPANVSEKLD